MERVMVLSAQLIRRFRISSLVETQRRTAGPVVTIGPLGSLPDKWMVCEPGEERVANWRLLELNTCDELT